MQWPCFEDHLPSPAAPHSCRHVLVKLGILIWRGPLAAAGSWQHQPAGVTEHAGSQRQAFAVVLLLLLDTVRAFGLTVLTQACTCWLLPTCRS
jgi:hypothetical protein